MDAPHVGSNMTMTLYRLDGCSSCATVAETLDDLGVDFESVTVARRHSERDAVKSVTGQRRVPALVDGERGVVVSQSARIVEYLETTYG